MEINISDLMQIDGYKIMVAAGAILVISGGISLGLGIANNLQLAINSGIGSLFGGGVILAIAQKILR